MTVRLNNPKWNSEEKRKNLVPAKGSIVKITGKLVDATASDLDTALHFFVDASSIYYLGTPPATKPAAPIPGTH